VTPPAAAALLLALVVPAMLINVYFTSLVLERWARLRGRLAWLFHACGAETSTCAAVVKTPYARIFGGVPNVALGIVWCVALAGLAVAWLSTGRVFVPWPFLAVAAGTLAVAAYLVYALVVVLKQPCPL
jgi:uncharacterized membrane protein